MVPFESGLERDLAVILEFDPVVAAYEAQPVQIEYERRGRRCLGVPDFLVTYRSDQGVPPLLCDVKYRDELFARWSYLKPRLKAAKSHADGAGWRYRILTEVEIRTPYLANARFLLPYRRLTPDDAREAALFQVVRSLGTPTARMILKKCDPEPDKQAELVSSLWSMLGRGLVITDLDSPLTMESVIRCPQIP